MKESETKMHSNFEEFQKKFKTSEYTIYETKYWRWSLRPVHSTLGSGILSLLRYEEKMSNLKEEEGIDLLHMIKIIEKTLKKVFDYDKINYLMLMMVDPHIHFHVLPRYSREIKFDNIVWVDKGWPALPTLGEGNCTDDLLFSIRETLKENIALSNEA